MKRCVTLLCVVWIYIVWGQLAQAERWAVIIGVEKYQDERLNLAYTQDDAEAIFQMLRTVGEIPERNILFLLNEQATKASISEAFSDWLPNRVGSDDFVVIYYAGHGIQGPDLEPEDEDDSRDEYLVPYDFDISSTKKISDSGVRDDLIAEWLGALPSKSIVIFDSCYSGSGIKAIYRGRPRTPYGLLPRTREIGSSQVKSAGGMQKEISGLSERVTFLAACQEAQSAYEYPALQHGFFTYYLLRGLQGNADQNNDGQIFASEAFTYAKQQMADDARISVLEQRPLLWTKNDNPFVPVKPTTLSVKPAPSLTPKTASEVADSKRIRVNLWLDIVKEDGAEERGIEDEEYQSGTTIKISFQVEQDCYLFVLNIDSQEKDNVSNFYPLAPEADESVWVEKDRIYSVEATLDDVVGEERFYAIASPYSFSVSQDVLPAVNKEFQARGLKLANMQKLDIPFSYATISFRHH